MSLAFEAHDPALALLKAGFRVLSLGYGLASHGIPFIEGLQDLGANAFRGYRSGLWLHSLIPY